MCPRGRGGSGPMGPGRVAALESHGVEGRCPPIVRKNIDAPALGASRAGPPFPYLRWSGPRRECRRGGHGRGRPAALPRLCAHAPSGPQLQRRTRRLAAPPPPAPPPHPTPPPPPPGRAPPRYEPHVMDVVAEAAGGPRILDV